MRANNFILKDEWFLEKNQNKDNFYDEESLNGFLDDDMISGAEGGFMIGYLEA